MVLADDLLETSDNSTHRVFDSGKLGSQVDGSDRKQLLDSYLKGEVALICNVTGCLGAETDNTESSEYVITFQEVSANPFYEADLAGLRNTDGAGAGQGISSYQAKFTVPVLPSTVMEKLEKSRQSRNSIWVCQMMTSKARLYRLDPSLQFVREWDRVEGRIIKRLLSEGDRELNPVRFGVLVSTAEGEISLPHGGVQSGPEVIEALTQFERERRINQRLGYSFQHTVPIVPYFMCDTVGIAFNESHAPRYEFTGMQVRAIYAPPAFLES